MDDKNISFEELLESLNSAIAKNNGEGEGKKSEGPKKDIAEAQKTESEPLEAANDEALEALDTSDTKNESASVQQNSEPEEDGGVSQKTSAFNPVSLRREKRNLRFTGVTDHHDRISGTFEKLKKRDVYQEPEISDEDDDVTKRFSQLKDASEFEASKKEVAKEHFPIKDSAADEKTVDVALKNALGLEGDEKDATVPTPVIPAVEQEEKPKLTKKIKDVIEKAEKSAKNAQSKKLSCEEYVNHEQAKKIMGRFRRESNRVLLRLIITAVLSFLIFYTDLAPVTGLNLLPAIFMPPAYNVVFVLLQMQLLFFIILVNNRSLFDGITALFSGAPNVNTVSFTATTVIIIHDVVTMLSCSSDFTVCVYNGVCALCILAGLVGEYLGLKTKMSSFKAASGKSGKYVITSISEGASETEVFRDYADDLRGEMYCVSKTKFPAGVMNKLNCTNPVEKTIKYVLPAALAMSAVFFFVTLKSGGYDAFHAFTLCFSMCMPISLFLAAFYPSAKAQMILEHSGTAILGAESCEKLAKMGVMSFNDSDVFPSTGIKVNNVNIYGNNRIDHVVYYAAGAFAKLGGPLKDVFSSATDDGAGSCENVTMLEIMPDGFTMKADGKTVIIGKATYLRRKGFLTETTQADSVYESKSGRIMYMAYDGAIAAKFYIKYTMDPEFDLLLQKADSIGLYVGIRSYDPNIDDSLLAHTLNLKKYPVKVVKLSFADDFITESETCDCPAVSKGAKGGSKALLSAVMLASKIRSVRTLNIIATFVAIAAAAVIMALLITAGTFISTFALYPILFQILWIAFGALMTNITLQ